MSTPQHPDVDCEVLADAMGPALDPPGSQPPPPPVRAARLFAAGDGLGTRLDALLERWLPRELNPLAQLGPAANAMLLLATLSGVLLLFWYSASVQAAWHSLADLGPRSLGGLVRSVHRYASDLAMLLVLAHAVRTFLARKFADARWLAWVSGIALLGLVWFIGWTGYWLVWDQRAQLLALDTMKAVDVLPIFGEPMSRLFTSDQTVPSLLFFVVFFLHMVLPLGIAGGLCLHLARLSRSQLLPNWRLTAWLTGAIVVAALMYPATNAAAARMAVKPTTLTMDWWFLWPLAVTARLSGGGLWVATFLATTGLMTVPWWLARRRPRPVYQATVNVSRCFSCTLCSHDCPFGAITMVPRTDGKPFPSQAQIDPDRCIGCGVCAGACDTQGIGLAWFDAQQVTRELEAFVATEVTRGTAPAFAFVCAQTAGGWELFDSVAWARRLPGYTVKPIPCVGWVEPKLIERLISKGAAAVLIVGCGSSEAFCKEGNQWLPARLNGTREPEFRPSRADPRKVAHVNFDPLRPQRLTDAAARLRQVERVDLNALESGRLQASALGSMRSTSKAFALAKSWLVGLSRIDAVGWASMSPSAPVAGVETGDHLSVVKMEERACSRLRAGDVASKLAPTASTAWIRLSVTACALVVLLVVSDAPFRNPAPAGPEFVFTFRAYGEWVSGQAAALPDPALDKRPVHMRTAQPTERTRSPVSVQLDVDGRTQVHVFRPKGFKSDGASVGELRLPLTPGRHRVTVSVATARNPDAARQTWSAEVDAQLGRLAVLSLEGNRGFEFSP